MRIALPSDRERARDRTPLEVFERIYQRDLDPWRCESSAGEREKYGRTLAALGERRYRRALEIGSGVGVLTGKLATRCEAVVALEPSASALAQASARLRSLEGVELIRGAAPEDLPSGPFDLVVCSEVLYYLSEPLLIDVLAEVEQRLARGGTLIAVHYAPSVRSRLRGRLGAKRRSPQPPTALSGRRVHELVREHTRLVHSRAESHPTYLLDRFDDRG